jgi:hypothetical protein
MKHRNLPFACFLGFIVLVISLPTLSQQREDAAPRSYVEEALNIMQKNALNRNSIDWQRVRQETIARANEAKTTIDTYPAIVYALTQLQENHSFLVLPDKVVGAEKVAIEAEMAKIRPLFPTKESPFSPSKDIQGHIDRRDGKTFAHVNVPTCLGPYADNEKNTSYYQEFANKLHALTLALEAKKPDGWIVDLRGNQGGNMYPMLAGIGALLGEGDLGAFEFPDGNRMPWFYKGGKVGTRTGQSEDISAELKQPPFVLAELPWVAVLVDRATGSAGEVVAISFAGRAHERSFGEHTVGLTTANSGHPLSDGAVLVLCEGLEADRTGRRYVDGIDPDVRVPASQTRPEEEKDTTLEAAKDWLSRANRSSR